MCRRGGCARAVNACKQVAFFGAVCYNAPWIILYGGAIMADKSEGQAKFESLSYERKNYFEVASKEERE